MAAVKCYPGDPTNEERRMAIWKWTKDNLIDKGVPLENIHKEVNDHFFGGVARPQLIADILGGRKTPLRPITKELWQNQYRRRQVVQQAQNLSKYYAKPAPVRLAQMAWEMPRFVSTLAHSTTFPGTHASRLLLDPKRWPLYIRGWMDNFRAFSPSEHTQMMNAMEKDDLFDRALKGTRGGKANPLDVAPNSRPDDIVSKYLLTANNPGVRSFLEGVRKWGVEPAERGWDALKVLRFNLWKEEFLANVKPGMTEHELNELSGEIADMANHATGSAKLRVPGMRESIPSGGLIFGPKLFASKWASLVSDPVKTLGTVAKMASGQETTAGERAAMQIRLTGLGRMAGTLLASQAVNWGVNKWAGVDDKDNVNMFHPENPGWLNWRVGGVEFGAGGGLSEMRFLGKIIATQMLNEKNKDWKTMNALIRYGREHLSPQAQYPFELPPGGFKPGGVPLFGTDPMGRPLPWSTEKGARGGFFQKMTPEQYAISKMPIFMEGPIGYIYDGLRQRGLSALDATSFMKGLAIMAGGLTGFHAHAQEEPKAPAGSSSPPAAGSVAATAPPVYAPAPARRSHHRH